MKKDYIYLNQFIWDIEKAQYNIETHHISFETACRIFNDPALYVYYDDKNSTAEETRYNCVGAVDGYLTILTVTMTEREEYIRIISARKLNETERRNYEKNAKNLSDN